MSGDGPPSGENTSTIAGGWAPLGDFNVDGFPDIVVANFYGETLGIFYNRGDGTFAAQSTLPASLAPSPVAFGDFNQDGAPDIAVACGDGSLKVFLSQCN